MIKPVEIQINQCLNLLQKLFDGSLLGVYLYGSAVVGGLQRYSDLDLFVVINRPSTHSEKQQLIRELLGISGLYMKDTKPPIEMTLVVDSDINPWRYPPLFDFQYGEWLRAECESGAVELAQTKEMPDLAVLITQINCGSLTLFGSNPEILLPQVPERDFIQAMHSDLERLISNLDSDTRNVLLTLARIWTTCGTKKLFSKPDAADWAIERLPVEHQTVMQRAKAICIGLEDEHWDDLKPQIRPCAEWILRQITTMK
ncbi:MAG: aminoglycoside adenylyltransferase family protein [Gammaproteobacteria bacterium]